MIPGPLNRGRGHTILLSSLSAELTSRGHDVTIVVPSDDYLDVGAKFTDSKATKIIKYPSLPYAESDFVKSYRAGNISKPGGPAIWAIMKEVMEEQASYCRQLLSNSSIMTRLKQEKFDLIIADMFNGCDVLLPKVLQVPFIALTPFTQSAFMNFFIFGFPLHVTPFWMQAYEDPKSLMVRVKNVLGKCSLHISGSLLASHFAELQTDFNISSNRNMFFLASKAQFWLSQDFDILEAPHPTMPNWSSVGGLAAARPGPLPSVSHLSANVPIDISNQHILY